MGKLSFFSNPNPPLAVLRPLWLYITLRYRRLNTNYRFHARRAVLPTTNYQNRQGEQ
jgi:hypothetical protein